MSEETTNVQPEGKGMAVTGFVLSLVGLIFASWVAAAAVVSIATGGSAWLMYLWDVVCIVSIVLSAMGMKKLGATGGKKGLGIAGLVIGIVATVYAIILTIGLSAAASMQSDLNDAFGDEWEQAMDDLEEAIENAE